MIKNEVSAKLKKLVGPDDKYCTAGGFDPNVPYLSFPSISVGITKNELSHAGSRMLDEIVAFDNAESSGVNLTQTNMVTVSSFCGLNGAILGIDLLPQELVRNPIIGDKYRNVFDLSPLTDAGRALFGTVKDRRYPIKPGQHLLCANKTIKASGPTTLYGALALAIPEDRNAAADLYMEDCGHLSQMPGRTVSKESSQLVLESLIHSVFKIGLNIGVSYKQIFIDLKTVRVKADEMGCVLIAAPYFRLAKKAVPRGGVGAMTTMTVKEWEDAHNF